MNTVSARDFFRYWVEVVNEEIEIKNNWNPKTGFTSIVKNSILPKVANKLQLECYAQDYYSIDAVLYNKDEDLVSEKIRPKNSYWFSRIRVAFEHENNFYSGLYKEISHLLITQCDLRVLVTYPEYDYGELKEPEDFFEIIKGSGQSECISKAENFLIIFGYQTDFTWQGYVYNDNKDKDWIRL